MAKFAAKLDNDDHINIQADEIEVRDDAVMAWKENSLVAYSLYKQGFLPLCLLNRQR